MREKISQWQEEIKTIAAKQKEMNRKYNERIRALKKKISDAEAQILKEENQWIARTVREAYGDLTPEILEMFRRKMEDAARENQKG